MKSNSVFKKLLFNNILIIILAIFLIMASVTYFICVNFRKNEINAIKDAVDQYASEIKLEITKAIQKSEYIINNNYVTNNLDKDFSMSTYDAYSFSNYIAEHLNSLSYDEVNDIVTIYSSNQTLFDSKYLLKSSHLKEYDKISADLKNNSINIIWDENLHSDERSRKYLVFYRKMSISNSGILMMKVYLYDYDNSNYDVILRNLADIQDGGSLLVFTPINDNLGAVSHIDSGRLAKQYAVIVLLFFVLFLIFCSGLSFLFYFTTDKITSNIENFLSELDVSNPLSANITNYNNADDDVYELKIIKKSLRILIENIKNMTRRQYNDELEKSRLKFEILQQRINPHLLYNSLSLINLIAFKRNDYEIINIVNALVDYYRMILSHGNEITTLYEELNMLKIYVRINEISHRKIYNYTTELPDDLKEFKIPNLLLQPFVENSILHGLSGSRENCFISVRAMRAENRIIIKITDNGYGISENTINKLNNNDYSNLGYGIKNAYERMRLYFNAESTISFRSTPGEGTCVFISFPV